MTNTMRPYLLIINDGDLEEPIHTVLDTLDDVAKMLGEYFAATGVRNSDGEPMIPVPEFHDINGYALALWLCDVADHVDCPVEWSVYGPAEIRSPGGQQVVQLLLTGHELADWCKRAGPMMALGRRQVTDVITSL